jgi:hypothetical protein
MVTLDNLVGLQTLVFDQRGVTDVTWTPLGTYAQFDNIDVTVVPEPGAYAMLLAGIAALVGVGRWRRRSR